MSTVVDSVECRSVLDTMASGYPGCDHDGGGQVTEIVDPDARQARRVGQVVEVVEHVLGSEWLPVRPTEDEAAVVVRRAGERLPAVASRPLA